MSASAFDFERLGVFYLGRPLDPVTLVQHSEPLLYDSRDLVTHAVIAGMTGSGKTGLGIGLLEEAALDGVPALVIDPKGDLANLLLTFPELRPEDFLPWVREDDATRKGVSRAELAASEAEKWRQGLAAWGQDGERIRRLRAAAEVTLYTPGSELGRPISILASFAAPPTMLLRDVDLLRDRVETAATSLLALAGVPADPLRSREHILVSTLFSEAWRAGRSYELAGLIADLQKPPLTKVGVLDLETFFPAADRFALAMKINNLLAAPGFDVWLRGEPLALGNLLRTQTGRPRIAVVSLAHLSDAERMFFVALLLNETISWMRAQAGTSSLRAIVYMDEVFGYLPPVENPPSKKPMLVLLKQARAFGLGMVLATQNPVDLDYKALSNIGTWILGRLQTERDKARVLDGLEGASTAAGEAFDRAALDRLLSGLRSRVFLLHNVHEEAPVLFESRWAMSYLAGPIDREGIRALSRGREGGQFATSTAGERTPSVAPNADRAVTTAAPLLPPEITQLYLGARDGGVADGALEPVLVGWGRAHVESAKYQVAEAIEVGRLARFSPAGAIDWTTAEEAPPATSFATAAPAGACFGELPSRAARPASYAKWERELATALARTAAVSLLRSSTLNELSRPGEDERAFRARLADRARAARDEAVERTRARFAARVRTLEERIRRAEARVEEQKGQADSRKLETAVSVGATVLGALFGRRKLSASTLGRAATSARSASRAAKEARDVDLARESVEALHGARVELEAEVEGALAAVSSGVDAASERLETVVVRPKRGDVEVLRLVLAWVPAAGQASG